MEISDLSKIILMPHVSEKSVMLADNVKQQTFRVASSASKKDVKEAVQQKKLLMKVGKSLKCIRLMNI